MPKKRRKKGERTKQREELWYYFSRYIKHRDGWRCYTCGAFVQGSNAHAGHFIPSSIGGLGLRYDETNVHCQCMRCNKNLQGNWPAYRSNMVKQYGEEHVRSLEARINQETTDFDFAKMIEVYKEKAKRYGVE